LRDPGLEDATAWELTNGATIIPDQEGPSGGGVASLAPNVVCSGGAIGQRVEMPPYDAAEPLVAEVTYRARDVSGIAVGFDRAWKPLPPTGEEWVTARFCVGEAAYGAEVAIQVASSEKTAACNELPVETGTIEVDRLTVEVASSGECPGPGEVINGDADPAEGGWRFTGQEGAVADFAIGAGRQGSDGVRIYTPTGGDNDRAAATTQVSVPLPTSAASPALRFWWKGTTDRFFYVDAGTFISANKIDRVLTTLRGTDQGREHIYCLPPWTHGSVIDLSFFLLATSPAGEIELVVDDVEIVLETGCSNDSDIHDPGFEDMQTERPGIEVFGNLNQSFEVIRDALRARSGEGFLEIAYETTHALVIVEQWVFVPEPDDRGGPLLGFHSVVPAEPDLQVRWVLGRAREREADLPTGGGWRLNEACLPARWANRWYRFQVWVGSAGVDGSAEMPVDPPKSVLLDDFEVTTSAACPGE
jgi:hypothetical protein